MGEAMICCMFMRSWDRECDCCRQAADYSRGLSHCNQRKTGRICPKYGANLARAGLAVRCQQEPRIDRLDASADLEMQLRPIDVAGLAGQTDHLTALDVVAACDAYGFGMRVGSDIAVVMLNQHEIAVPLELIAGIGNRAGSGSMNGCSAGGRDVDAVVAFAVGFGPER